MPYFDHNATTPLLPAAREAWLEAAGTAWQNPGSPYQAAARVHRLLEEARAAVGALLDVPAAEIVFTSGATEANNAVIAWAARTLPSDAPVLVSPVEHPSVLEAARTHFGARVRALPLAAHGSVAPEAVAAGLRGARAGFVAVMAANNETGVLQHDLAAIDGAAAAGGAVFLCDASQWIGRLPARGIATRAFLVGCAHKFGGPKGVGLLRVPPGASGFYAQRGGAQEHARRGGTENYPGVAAMVAALQHAETSLRAPDFAERARWKEAFVARLQEGIPGVRRNGPPGLWNTVSLTLPAGENTRWVARLDRLGFQVSTGSACATGSAHPSHVLAALGLPPEEARRTIRVSAGWETPRQDWEELADACAKVWREFQAEKGGGGAVVITP